MGTSIKISATTFIEQPIAGQLGVHIRNPYVRDQTPPDYPFVVDNDKDAAEVTAALLADPAGHRSVVEGTRDWLRQKYERHGVARRTVEWLRGLVDRRRNKELSGKTGTIAQLVVQAAESLPQPVTWADLMQECTKRGKSDRPWGRGAVGAPQFLRSPVQVVCTLATMRGGGHVRPGTEFGAPTGPRRKRATVPG